MSEVNVKDALNFARAGKASNFKDIIASLLKNKIFNSISDRKTDIARTMFKKGESQGE